MKKVKKLFCSFVISLSALLSGTCTTLSFARPIPVQAFAPALAAPEIFLLLLGFLGISLATPTWNDINSSPNVPETTAEFMAIYLTKFYNFCVTAGETYDGAVEWLQNATEGVVDTASNYWELFKDYVRMDILPLTNPNGAVASVPGHVDVISSLKNVEFYLGSGTLTYFEIDSVSQADSIIYLVPLVSGNSRTLMFVSNKPNNTISVHYKNKGEDMVRVKDWVTSIPVGDSGLYYSYANNMGNLMYWSNTAADFSFGDYVAPLDETVGNNLNDWVDKNLDTSLELDPPFVNDRNVTEKDIDNVGLFNPATGAMTGDIDINLKNTLSWADVMTGLKNGTLTWDDVGTLVGTRPYDTTTDMVIDKEGVTDIPVDDVISDADKNSTAEKLKNPSLIMVFPFCIPWDIYNIFKLLAAEPVAPNFDFSFPYMDENGIQYTEHRIDLSPFNSVASVVRVMFNILFVLGLIILTRYVIKG